MVDIRKANFFTLNYFSSMILDASSPNTSIIENLLIDLFVITEMKFLF